MGRVLHQQFNHSAAGYTVVRVVVSRYSGNGGSTPGVFAVPVAVAVLSCWAGVKSLSNFLSSPNCACLKEECLVKYSSLMRQWRNWQTRKIKDLVVIIDHGGSSPLCRIMISSERFERSLLFCLLIVF